ncbi:AtpZ/AtpI family protein [Flammeovirga sp. OC4]|uniref:AtpZ/AtpI family protein n=1 Tax=Flammeovirga sp. OC4 TaxID=1382345 RepID=UPI0005C5AA9C|nr:AtpZ/AtpI family protein [Flammeovirga sp. OC4]
MKQHKEEHSDDTSKPKKAIEKYSTFLRYTSLSTEMIVTMLICAYSGRYLDNIIKANGPYCTIGFLLFGTFASLVILINGLKKISNKKGEILKKKGKHDNFSKK